MSISQVLKHIPAGLKAPALLSKFVQAKPPFRIEWSEPDGLNDEATKQVVPFMRLYDGDLVALWFCAKEPAVVMLGHGETEVLARNFREFVENVNAGKSRISDFDLQETPFIVPGVPKKVNPRPSAIQKQFDSWTEQQSSAFQPKSDDSQLLLKQILLVIKKMVKDGYVKADAWEADFDLIRQTKGWKLTFMKFGKRSVTYPRVPAKYPLQDKFEALIPLCKKQSLLLCLNPHRFAIIMRL